MQYGGTGLGLSISKRLIELMNGKIAFKSKEGVGTVFQVTVPLEKVVHSTFAEEAPKDVEYKASTYYTRAELLKLKGQLPSQKVDDINTNSPAAPINQAQHKKVLIVDDEPAFRLLAERFLQQQGYQVAGAANLDETRTKLQQFDADLILLDLALPPAFDPAHTLAAVPDTAVAAPIVGAAGTTATILKLRLTCGAVR